MSNINSVRNLQILYFSKKNKEIKNLKNGKKSDPISAFIHTTRERLLKDIFSILQKYRCKKNTVDVLSK